MKRTRLCTNRAFEGRDYEAIEIDERGVMYWVAAEFDPEDGRETAGAAFPCDIEFVAEFFERVGRQLDRSRLPANAVLQPWACNL